MTEFARELWRRLETVHAVTYFAPESRDAAGEIGVRGFWRCYFGYRAAPLGACSAGVVTASFFGFAPTMVERAIPSIWDLASPAAFVEARTTSARAALSRLAGEQLDRALEDRWLLDVLDTATRAGIPGGRPLFAANLDLELPGDGVEALWQLATTLREHRGDGHVNAWSSRGFGPLEVAVMFVAAGATSRESLQPNRGWTDEEWEATTAELEARGLLVGGTLTDRGAQVRTEVEHVTDVLAGQPFSFLSEIERGRLLDLLDPPVRAITESGLIPAVNPMGVPLVR